MKQILFVLIVSQFIFAGCAGETRYIEILYPDTIFYGGQADFQVEPGDTLQILSTKICRGGFGTCWEVKDLKTNWTGYVNSSRMEERHRIYTVLGSDNEGKKKTVK